MAKYDNIEVKLVGRDGNAFVILRAVLAALKKAKVPKEEVDMFLKEAKSGDYDHLLRTCCEWVNVC